MDSEFVKTYKKGLWGIYANAVSMIGILTFVVAFIIGGYDLIRLAFPQFTLNSALYEKYQTNESYTEFGKFRNDVPEKDVTYERTANYQKLLRIERQNALQRLVKVGLAVVIVTILNGILIFTFHKKAGRLV